MFLAFCILTIGWLTTSSSANMVVSYGTCPEVPGQENFDWNLHRGRWYVEEAFDVPYLTHLYCMTIDYIPVNNETVMISTNGIRHYDW
ncbi:unnamed protein product [Candidula unifasciata]|uniref:Uncharacterized protein n=1 Tax=Candidula unifasciata TaxID=100452 RepID=A0A8S3ZEL3_9EUPU|nr:unnamed protein product [Candidula unifasciata]